MIQLWGHRERFYVPRAASGRAGANGLRLATDVALIRADALEELFRPLDKAIDATGSIVDATLVAAQRQRNTEDEKAAVKGGAKAHEIWREQPAKALQSGTGAR